MQQLHSPPPPPPPPLTSTTMEPSLESFSYGLHLSFDSDSFIEFDLKLMSMRWNTTKSQEHDTEEPTKLDSSLLQSLSLDSTKSLLFYSNRHQSRYFYAVPSLPISNLGDSGATQIAKSGESAKRSRNGFSFQRYMWLVLMKLCRRMKMRREKGGSFESRGRGSKVFDVETCCENPIQDAVLYCKNSNLSSLMEDVCKGD